MTQLNAYRIHLLASHRNDSRPIAEKIAQIYKKKYFLSPLILQKLIWVPTIFILRFFGHIKIHGLDNLYGVESPVIFASNHTSETDPFFVPGTLPFFSRFSPMFYLSREKSFYRNSGWRQFFYGGLFFKAWGSYPVYTGIRNYSRSLNTHRKIICDGGSLFYFPEGKITPDGEIKEAKGGVAYLAYLTRVPIIPVRIKGSFGMNFKDFILRKYHFSIHYGKPIYVLQENRQLNSISDFKIIANQVMDEIRKM